MNRLIGGICTALLVAISLTWVSPPASAQFPVCAPGQFSVEFFLYPTCTYDTPGEFSYTVGDFVTEIWVEVTGGRGGAGGDVDPRVVSRGIQGETTAKARGGEGGFGVRVRSTVRVTPGDVLHIIVGENGEPGTWSPDGLGANGGAGGGASEVYVGPPYSTRAIVAGGGGGGGGGGDHKDSPGGDGGDGIDVQCEADEPGVACGSSGGHGEAVGQQNDPGLGGDQPCEPRGICNNTETFGARGQHSFDDAYSCETRSVGLRQRRGESSGGSGGSAGDSRLGAGGGGGGGWHGGCGGPRGTNDVTVGAGAGGGAGSSVDKLGEKTQITTTQQGKGSVVVSYYGLPVVPRPDPEPMPFCLWLFGVEYCFGSRPEALQR